jgi:hypothetical protein
VEQVCSPFWTEVCEYAQYLHVIHFYHISIVPCFLLRDVCSPLKPLSQLVSGAGKKPLAGLQECSLTRRLPFFTTLTRLTTSDYHIIFRHSPEQDKRMAPHTGQSQNSQQSSTGQQTLQAPSNNGTLPSAVSGSAFSSIGTFRALRGRRSGPVSFQSRVRGDLDMVVRRVDPVDRSQGFYIYSVSKHPPRTIDLAPVPWVDADTWFECEADPGFSAHAKRDPVQPTTITYGVTYAPQQSTQDQLPTPEQSPPPTTAGG